MPQSAVILFRVQIEMYSDAKWLLPNVMAAQLISLIPTASQKIPPNLILAYLLRILWYYHFWWTVQLYTLQLYFILLWFFLFIKDLFWTPDWVNSRPVRCIKGPLAFVVRGPLPNFVVRLPAKCRWYYLTLLELAPYFLLKFAELCFTLNIKYHIIWTSHWSKLM